MPEGVRHLFEDEEDEEDEDADPFKLSPSVVVVDTAKPLGEGKFGVVYQGTFELRSAGAGTGSQLGGSGGRSEGADAGSQPGGNGGVGGPGGIRCFDVAVKMLPQDREVTDSERQDLWEEAKILRKVQCLGGHPNVVRFWVRYRLAPICSAFLPTAAFLFLELIFFRGSL